jgi:type I restriction enzyme, R subunit
MKFTEEKLEKAFTELVGQEGLPNHLGITMTHETGKLYI